MRASEVIGNGVLAGSAGTAAMTLSSTLESGFVGGSPASVPSRAAAMVLGVEPREQERFATIVHWGYGT
jgi:hypothetical protein